ncbi:MAG: VanZ family protein [Lachnospiraceae bacterium]|nr:VanZ family protein [Lachnospiraceae bacterium]MCI9151720.1 VanZ family protein [Lachnospiraceae bacterium]
MMSGKFSEAGPTLPANKKQLAKRAFLTAALVCCIAFIFSNSMENGVQSSARSGSATEFINSLLEEIGMGPVTEHMIRKTAHFLEYALEGCLLLLVLWAYGLSLLRYFGWGLLGGVLTALTDESIQLFSSGRSGQVADVWIDTGGVLWGMLVMAVLVSVFSAKRRTRSLK